MKTFIKDTEARLFDKRVLRMLRMNRRSMVSFLEETGWRRHIKAFDDSSNHSAVALEKALRPVLDCFSTEPEGGWLPYIHDDILAFLYPDNFTVCRKGELRQGAVFFWSITGYCWLMRKVKEGFHLWMTSSFLKMMRSKGVSVPVNTGGSVISGKTGIYSNS